MPASNYHPTETTSDEDLRAKRTADTALVLLKRGNDRFHAGVLLHPRRDTSRRVEASTANQSDHALATLVSCSDSRVPVEILFDMGIMDLFVVRTAGASVNEHTIGSVEFGALNVMTPLLVVLGHTGCGAVSAAVHDFQWSSTHHSDNIRSILRPIKPAVRRAVESDPDLTGPELVNRAVEEHVWQTMADIFLLSPGIREKAELGHIRPVGVVYHLDTGRTRWLMLHSVEDVLRRSAMVGK